jgi:export-related chaperone CsaA
MPKTKAYYEIWLDEEKIIDKKDEEDPLYQDRYMPRKFKIAIAIPPNNDIDVFTNDIGLIAIIEDNKLRGFNIAIGGGLSTTLGNAQTYARLGTVIGFAESEEKTLKAIYEILTVQRDFGNRSDRKIARLKYTVDRLGVEKFKEEVEKRLDFKLEKARPYTFNQRSDYYGWYQNNEGKWYYTVFVENGRILDDEQVTLKSALLEVAKTDKVNFMINYSDFAKVNIRVGEIIDVQDFPEARKPAYKLTIDFGSEIGTKKSSVQTVANYKKEDLVGKQIIGVVNFPPKQIGPFISEVLTLGVMDEEGNVVLLMPSKKAKLGSKMF